MTTEDIQKLLKNPIVLLFVMLLGGLCSIGKQLRGARKAGVKVTLADYFTHWPEMTTAMMLLVVSFIGMIQSGTLNFVSAWTTGYASNSLADLFPLGERSTSMAVTPPPNPPMDQR